MEPVQKIPNDVAQKLGYYVYAYVNPLDGLIFYVGKGKGHRALSHLGERAESQKVMAIKQIRAAGNEPPIDILAHGLQSEEAALLIETAVIDALGLPFLTNKVRGWRSSRYGRTPLKELIAIYRRHPVSIKEPSILIRITQLYRPQMSAVELYATRTSWKVSQHRKKVRYAFAVSEGIVREVYEIAGWLPAGSTFNTRNPRGVPAKGRWEFVGRVASETIRRKYINRDVSAYFKQGAQNPISYVNVRPTATR